MLIMCTWHFTKQNELVAKRLNVLRFKCSQNLHVYKLGEHEQIK